jgi:hypothetical protein
MDQVERRYMNSISLLHLYDNCPKRVQYNNPCWHLDIFEDAGKGAFDFLPHHLQHSGTAMVVVVTMKLLTVLVLIKLYFVLMMLLLWTVEQKGRRVKRTAERLR